MYLCVMCYDVLCHFGNLSCFWSCVNRSTLVFKLLPATDLFQASEAASACNFLGQPTLFMCQTSFISARVNKSGPGIGSQWVLKHLQTLARSERPRKKGLGGFSDLNPDLFPPWKRLYEWNFGVRKCLWSPKFPTSNMVVNSYTPVMHVRICK